MAAEKQDVQFVKPKISVNPFDEKGQLQQTDIENRLKLAAALQEAGKQPDKTEVVSGVAVPQSPWAGLARALTQTAGGYQQGQAERQADELQRSQLADMVKAAGSGSGLNPDQAKTLLQIDPTGKALGDAYAGTIKANQEKELKQVPAGGGMTFGDASPTQSPTTPPPTISPQVGPQSNIQMTPQIMAESGGNPNAISPKGAQGLMQLMPTTAANPGFGVQPVQDNSPQENVRVGQQYMQALTGKYGGDQSKALAAYNWGPGNVDKMISTNGWDLNKLPPETRAYVAKLSGQPMPTTQQPQALPPMNQQQSFADQQPPQVSPQGQLPPQAPFAQQNGQFVTANLPEGAAVAKDPASGQIIQQQIPNVQAKQKLDESLQRIQSYIDDLDKEGGVSNPNHSALSNISDTVANSDPSYFMGGQTIGRALGTKQQDLRSKIEQEKSNAAALYIKAAGLTSGQTNSQVEQERFLKGLGNLTSDYGSQQQALENLSRTHGLGTIKAKGNDQAYKKDTKVSGSKVKFLGFE